MVKVKKDLTGQVFGRLIVIGQAEDYVYPNSTRRMAQWECECSCPNKTKTIVSLSNLLKGTTKSCGCLLLENGTKKTNSYCFDGDTVIGKSSNSDDLFYCDIEDFDKIKNISWMVTRSRGYSTKQLVGRLPGTRKNIYFHRLLGYKWHDHISRNALDNRRSNFRPATRKENARNKSLMRNNKSKIAGVSWFKRDKCWRAYITIDVKQKHLGYFSNKDDAIKARLQAEKQYFGDFAPQQFLYEEYGII